VVKCAGWAIAFVLLGWAPGVGAGEAALSWSGQERVTRVSAADIGSKLYLSVDSDAELDSLGFYLNWVAAEPGAEVRLLGVRAAGAEAPGRWQAADSEPAGGIYRPIDRFLTEPNVLQRAERREGAVWRYELVLEVAISGTERARIEAAGLVGRASGGQIVTLGRPAVNIGTGWGLAAQPVVTEWRGTLNRRMLRSSITLRGIDLDQLVRLILEDRDGGRTYPFQVGSRSPQQLELVFSPSMIRQPGLLTAEQTSSTGMRERVPSVVVCDWLKEAQPGDVPRAWKTADEIGGEQEQ